MRDRLDVRPLSADEIARALERPNDFGYGGDNAEMFRTWSLGPVIETRDSPIVDRANRISLERELAKHPEWESDWEITLCHHWAVGWVDHLSYRVAAPVAEFVRAWFAYLHDEYPIADEDLFSTMEYEATLENIAEVGRNLVADGAPASWPSDVYGLLPDRDTESDGNGGYPRTESVRKALAELNLLDQSEGENV